MQPITLEKPIAKDFILIVAVSLLIGLAGQFSVPLWFTPIPLALQSAAILASSLFLGAKRGTIATALFLLEGALGLPVFSNGLGGFLVFLSPRGGYLIGYLLASYLVGWMSDRKQSTLLTLIVGSMAIYVCGASYFATFVGIKQAIALGVLPFLLGDAIKIGLVHRVYTWYNLSR